MEIQFEEGTPPVFVVFRGTIVPALTSEPDTIGIQIPELSDLMPKLTLHLRSRRRSPHLPTLAGKAPDWIRKVDIVAETDSGTLPDKEAHGSWEVQLELDLRSVARDARGKLTFHLRDADGVHAVDVPYQLGALEERLAIHPSQFYFGTIAVGETVEAKAVLRFPVSGRDATAPTSSLPVSLEEYGHLEIREIAPGRCLATLSLRPTSPGPIREAVVISLGDGRTASLQVPVVAVVARSD
jgi:hypothetical protein